MSRMLQRSLRGIHQAAGSFMNARGCPGPAGAGGGGAGGGGGCAAGAPKRDNGQEKFLVHVLWTGKGGAEAIQSSHKGRGCTEMQQTISAWHSATDAGRGPLLLATIFRRSAPAAPAGSTHFHIPWACSHRFPRQATAISRRRGGHGSLQLKARRSTLKRSIQPVHVRALLLSTPAFQEEGGGSLDPWGWGSRGQGDGVRGGGPCRDFPWVQETAKRLDSDPNSLQNCQVRQKKISNAHVGHINGPFTCPSPIARLPLTAVTKLGVASSAHRGTIPFATAETCAVRPWVHSQNNVGVFLS